MEPTAPPPPQKLLRHFQETQEADFQYRHRPTQPQHELELDLIMGRNPPTNPPHPQELLMHFQATYEADFRYTTLF